MHSSLTDGAFILIVNKAHCHLSECDCSSSLDVCTHRPTASLRLLLLHYYNYDIVVFPSENYSEIEGCSDRDNYQYHPSESSDLHDLEPMSVQHGGHYPAYSQRGSSNISSAAPLQEIRGNGGETDHMIMSHQLNEKHYSQNCSTKGKIPNIDKSK